MERQLLRPPPLLVDVICERSLKKYYLKEKKIKNNSEMLGIYWDFFLFSLIFQTFVYFFDLYNFENNTPPRIMPYFGPTIIEKLSIKIKLYLKCL